MTLDYFTAAPGFWYLASPYSHVEPETQNRRARTAFHAMAWLLAQRVAVYSPIHHCHDVASRYDLPTDAAYWKNLNQIFIRQSVGLIVLLDDGWRESIGVAGEVAYARNLKKPIFTIMPHEPHALGVYYESKA